jgi:hypothetical protein
MWQQRKTRICTWLSKVNVVLSGLGFHLEAESSSHTQEIVTNHASYLLVTATVFQEIHFRISWVSEQRGAPPSLYILTPSLGIRKIAITSQTKEFSMATALYQTLKVIVEAVVTAVLDHISKTRYNDTSKQ